VVVGGGHNGLVAATYLAQAGLSVLVLERLQHVGGAAFSGPAFAGLPVRVPRYSSPVSALPDQVLGDLGLDLELRARPVASYAPVQRDGAATGLLVERSEGPATATSFRELTGSDREYDAWRRFHDEVREFAQAVAPTLLEPLRTARQVRELVDPATWDYLVEEPLGRVLEERFTDDTVRGVVATDALIGTFADLGSESLAQNRCFLYQAIGNGYGGWRVPAGGIGALSETLADAARKAGATIVTGAGVSGIESDGAQATVTWHDGQGWRPVACDWVLSNVAPWVLQVLLGEDAGERPEGSQLTVSMLLERLPRLRSGVDAETAFGGTLHVAEGYSQLQRAHAEAEAGTLPSVQPGQLRCSSDASGSAGPADAGMHTLTYLGLHTPARLFEDDPVGHRDAAVEHALDAINDVLEEPIESLLALDENGVPCLEANAPHDIDEALAMPGGHIFHGELSWPWASNRALLDSPAQRWGVSTDVANVLLCGSGARRGGTVSGIGGHNAARAVLETRNLR
jgi:phytoene dehydrogenase-like protein